MSAPSSSSSQLPASTWRATALVLAIASLVMAAMALQCRNATVNGRPAPGAVVDPAAQPYHRLVLRGVRTAPVDPAPRPRQRKALRAAT